MPGKMTSTRAGSTPRATKSSRVLWLMAWNPARSYARGIGRSAAHTSAATGQLASANAVVPNRCGTMAQNGSAVSQGRNSGSLLMSSTTTS
jgi:hypothetical protein